VLALLLAAIGLYGVMSYNVMRRTNEIGIRIALGARTPAVQWMILSESLLLLAIGIGMGLPLTLIASKYIKDQLFGLTAMDPITFARRANTSERGNIVSRMVPGTPSDASRPDGSSAL